MRVGARLTDGPEERPDVVHEFARGLHGGEMAAAANWSSLAAGATASSERAEGSGRALVVGDGALGFWSAVREVFPETCEQRCW